MLTNNIVTTLRLLSVWLMVVYSTYVQSYSPVHNEAFYVPPSSLTQYQRGDLIRWEREPDMNHDFFTQYAVPYRIMYVSKGASGQKVAVTAMVFIPFVDGNGNPVTGKLDAIVWAHGTVGVGDNCAPSNALYVLLT